MQVFKPNPLLQGGTLNVECASQSFCGAFSGYGDVFTYDGNTWSSGSHLVDEQVGGNPGTYIGQMSCPVAGYCMVTGKNMDTPFFYIYSNGKWSQSRLQPSFDILSLSCVNSSYCMAGGTNGQVYMYSNGNWSQVSDLNLPSGNSYGAYYVGVTCVPDATVDLCAAGGSDTWIYFNGSWTHETMGENGQVSIECTKPLDCILQDLTTNNLYELSY